MVINITSATLKVKKIIILNRHFLICFIKKRIAHWRLYRSLYTVIAILTVIALTRVYYGIKKDQ